MNDALQIASIIAGFSGWGALLFHYVLTRSRQAQQLESAVTSAQLAEKDLSETRRRFRRQLIETRLCVEVQQVLSERLAEVEGGKWRTKLIEARRSARSRLGQDFMHHKAAGTASGIEDLLELLDNPSARLRFEGRAVSETPTSELPFAQAA